MNDLTPIEMHEFKLLEDAENPRPRRRLGRAGWIVLVAAAGAGSRRPGAA